MNGVDRAAEAIKHFYIDGKLDQAWFLDNIELWAENTQSLYTAMHNTRRPAHSVAYDAMISLLNNEAQETLSSVQYKAAFKKLGLDFKEILAPLVDIIESLREEDKADDTLNESEEKENVNYDDPVLNDIYNNLQDGISYGRDVTNVTYPYFDEVLYLVWNDAAHTEKAIGWSYYGSSANANTLDGLHFILNQIFEMTPEEFISRYKKNTESQLNESKKIITEKSLKENVNSLIIHTGLTDQNAKDVLDSVIGQLSDGIWENTPSMKRFWQFMDVDRSGSEIVVTFNTDDYRSGFRDKNEEQLRKWLATKVKQIVKEEGLEWNRDNTETVSYMHGDVTVQDAYRVYDKLLGRKDYIPDPTKVTEAKVYPKKIKTADGYILTKVNDGTYDNAFIPLYRNEAGDETLIPDVEKYTVIEEDLKTEGTKQKRIARYHEFDNGNVLHSWYELDSDEAEEQAKQASIEDPTDIYYVAFDDIMNPSSDYRWYQGKQYTIDEIQDVVKRINDDRYAKLLAKEKKEESKKYDVYILAGEDGVYNSRYMDTVDSIEQAEDRVAELRAENGCGAYYEEVNDTADAEKELDELQKELRGIDVSTLNNEEYAEYKQKADRIKALVDIIYKTDKLSESIDFLKRDWEKLQKDPMVNAKEHWSDAYYDEVTEYGKSLNEECSQASGVASGVNGKIDSFPINPKEMEKQRLKEDKNIILDFINQCINSGKFNEKQINEIKYGVEDGLTLEQLKLYADPKFNNYQMYEIRWGFKDGLTLEQVKTYADSKISDSEMWNIREKLEGNYEEEDDSLFEALNELIDYLNDNTDYIWDANEMYDNCAITESEDDYIEVFCWLNNGKLHYTINSEGEDKGRKYTSLKAVVKNLPLLPDDEDEDDDAEEYQADMELDQKKTAKYNLEGPASYEDLKKAGAFDNKTEAKQLTEDTEEQKVSPFTDKLKEKRLEDQVDEKYILKKYNERQYGIYDVSTEEFVERGTLSDMQDVLKKYKSGEVEKEKDDASKETPFSDKLEAVVTESKKLDESSSTENYKDLATAIYNWYDSDMGTHFDEVQGNEEDVYNQILSALENKDEALINKFIQDISESAEDDPKVFGLGTYTIESLVAKLNSLLNAELKLEATNDSDTLVWTSEYQIDDDDLKEIYDDTYDEDDDDKPDFETWKDGYLIDASEDVWQVQLDDFKYFVLPMIFNQCNEDVLILNGNAQTWRGTHSAGKIIPADESKLLDLLSDYDAINVKADKSTKQLYIEFIHHDGTHVMYLYTLPADSSKVKELALAAGYEQEDYANDQDFVDSFITDIYYGDVTTADIQDKLNLLVPIVNKDNKQESKLQESDDGYEQFLTDREKEIFDALKNEPEEKTTYDYLVDRVGQELSISELNQILQDQFNRQNEVFLIRSELYNMDPEEMQELVVWDGDDMYTINYKIKDMESGIVEIEDVILD